MDPDAMPDQLLVNVMDGISGFIMGAGQFDGITMLSLKVFRTGKRQIRTGTWPVNEKV